MGYPVCCAVPWAVGLQLYRYLHVFISCFFVVEVQLSYSYEYDTLWQSRRMLHLNSVAATVFGNSAAAPRGRMARFVEYQFYERYSTAVRHRQCARLPSGVGCFGRVWCALRSFPLKCFRPCLEFANRTTAIKQTTGVT